MTYQINPYVKDQNHLRFHAGERHYIEQLESRDGILWVDNIAVDAEQLVMRPFQCDTHWCMRQTEKDGVKKCAGSCCTDLEVDVTPTEIGRLRELGKAAIEKLQFGPRDPLGEIARRMAEARFTEITDEGNSAFIHMRNGRCALGWLPRDGGLRCAINSLCLALELPLNYYKPDPCFLFPLHTVEHAPGQHFITVVCAETYRAIGADAYVSRLRCVRKPQPGSPPALLSLKYEIMQCFGQDFYRALAAAALPRVERAGMAEHARTLAEEAAAR